MVRTYRKKTRRREIDENRMKEAIRSVLNKRMSERVAAVHFYIKRGSLHSRIEKLKRKNSPEKLASLYNDDSGNESNGRKQGNSRKGKSRIYTDTPEKERLEEIENERKS